MDKAGESDFTAPLADRMRPRNLDEFIGQKHILGSAKPLRRMIERDLLSPLIFHGPPGTGKSSAAGIITNKTNSAYIRMNAVLSNVKELREAVKQGEANARNGKRTILYLDEIHRFNKSQQDALLPALEAGSVILIGSTTQNPYFYLNNALLSRVNLFAFKPLEEEDILQAIEAALADGERGLAGDNLIVDEQAKTFIAKSACGDLRRALSLLEFAALSVGVNELDEGPHIDLDMLKDIAQKAALQYDGGGDEHYDIISAFIKSVRGSDPDAAVYYLAQMIESGEDPRFIARRLAILAAEDVGLAEPNALNVAASTVSIVDFIGMPEGRIPLSECTIYLSLCPKSNSAYLAVDKAIADVKEGKLSPVPNHLRDRHSGAFDKGADTSYLYPHDYPYHVVKQSYMTHESSYYRPQELGAEKTFKQRHEWIRRNIFGSTD